MCVKEAMSKWPGDLGSLSRRDVIGLLAHKEIIKVVVKRFKGWSVLGVLLPGFQHHLLVDAPDQLLLFAI